MLIGLISTSYSGKGTVTEYLVKNHSFQILPDDLDEEDDISAYILKENRWTCNYVFYPNLAKCEYYMKRPFFLLVYIDASIMIRFERYLNLNSTAQDFNNDLTLFITNNDPLHVNLPLVRLMYKADIRLYNSGNCIQTFYKYLDRCDLTNKDRLRPSWDTYFIRLCDWSARRSNCMKRRVGCILVKNNRILATGYNGTPRGVKNCNEGGCPRCNSGSKCGTALDQCFCIHAEENALIEAGRERIESNGGMTILYCSTCPCLGCAKKIIQAGVVEVVYLEAYGMDEMTEALFIEAGVKMRQYKPVVDGVSGTFNNSNHFEASLTKMTLV